MTINIKKKKKKEHKKKNYFIYYLSFLIERFWFFDPSITSHTSIRTEVKRVQLSSFE